MVRPLVGTLGDLPKSPSVQLAGEGFEFGGLEVSGQDLGGEGIGIGNDEGLAVRHPMDAGGVGWGVGIRRCRLHHVLLYGGKFRVESVNE